MSWNIAQQTQDLDPSYYWVNVCVSCVPTRSVSIAQVYNVFTVCNAAGFSIISTDTPFHSQCFLTGVLQHLFTSSKMSHSYFEIIFDNHKAEYQAGTMITGKVLVVRSKPVKVRGELDVR